MSSCSRRCCRRATRRNWSPTCGRCRGAAHPDPHDSAAGVRAADMEQKGGGGLFGKLLRKRDVGRSADGRLRSGALRRRDPDVRRACDRAKSPSGRSPAPAHGPPRVPGASRAGGRSRRRHGRFGPDPVVRVSEAAPRPAAVPDEAGRQQRRLRVGSRRSNGVPPLCWPTPRGSDHAAARSPTCPWRFSPKIRKTGPAGAERAAGPRRGGRQQAGARRKPRPSGGARRKPNASAGRGGRARNGPRPTRKPRGRRKPRRSARRKQTRSGSAKPRPRQAEEGRRGRSRRKRLEAEAQAQARGRSRRQEEAGGSRGQAKREPKPKRSASGRKKKFASGSRPRSSASATRPKPNAGARKKSASDSRPRPSANVKKRNVGASKPRPSGSARKRNASGSSRSQTQARRRGAQAPRRRNAGASKRGQAQARRRGTQAPRSGSREPRAEAPSGKNARKRNASASKPKPTQARGRGTQAPRSRGQAQARGRGTQAPRSRGQAQARGRRAAAASKPRPAQTRRRRTAAHRSRGPTQTRRRRTAADRSRGHDASAKKTPDHVKRKPSTPVAAKKSSRGAVTKSWWPATRGQLCRIPRRTRRAEGSPPPDTDRGLGANREWADERRGAAAKRRLPPTTICITSSKGCACRQPSPAVSYPRGCRIRRVRVRAPKTTAASGEKRRPVIFRAAPCAVRATMRRDR